MVDTIKEQWSRGGAMFHILYLALTRKYLRAVLIIIGLFIPFVNFVVFIALFIIGGLKGNSWMESDSSLTSEQKNTYITLFDRIGYFIFLTIVVVIVVSLIFMLLGGGLFMFNMMYDGERFDGPDGGFGMMRDRDRTDTPNGRFGMMGDNWNDARDNSEIPFATGQ